MYYCLIKSKTQNSTSLCPSSFSLKKYRSCRSIPYKVGKSGGFLAHWSKLSLIILIWNVQIRVSCILVINIISYIEW